MVFTLAKPESKSDLNTFFELDELGLKQYAVINSRTQPRPTCGHLVVVLDIFLPDEFLLTSNDINTGVSFSYFYHFSFSHIP